MFVGQPRLHQVCQLTVGMSLERIPKFSTPLCSVIFEYIEDNFLLLLNFETRRLGINLFLTSTSEVFATFVPISENPKLSQESILEKGM